MASAGNGTGAGVGEGEGAEPMVLDIPRCGCMEDVAEAGLWMWMLILLVPL